MKIDLPYSILESSKSLKTHDRAYANSLSLYAVDWYLKCLQFSTKLVPQDDWWLKYISESAHLEIVGVGSLECIPVIGNPTIAQMPIDAQVDRVGYIFVRLDDDLTSAEIIGFTPNYAEEVRLDRLQSTDDLIEHLCNLASNPVSKPEMKVGAWFDGLIATGWELISTLNSPQLAYRGGSSDTSNADFDDGGNRENIRLRQIINLGSISLLLLATWPSIDDNQRQVTIQLRAENCPDGTLPAGLKFSAIDDETGAEISKVDIKSGDIYGQIVLKGEQGEKFQIAIELGDLTQIESCHI